MKIGSAKGIRFLKEISNVRPMPFLLYAYLPEHYKNGTGTTRRLVMVDLGLTLL